jgi:hypothetical protein
LNVCQLKIFTRMLGMTGEKKLSGILRGEGNVDGDRLTWSLILSIELRSRIALVYARMNYCSYIC